ncbi:MAG: hypothetical protein CVU56_13520, partial [Deltaproteobacteria bacterium HGW-Deltaproteobacteria-14]
MRRLSLSIALVATFTVGACLDGPQPGLNQSDAAGVDALAEDGGADVAGGDAVAGDAVAGDALAEDSGPVGDTGPHEGPCETDEDCEGALGVLDVCELALCHRASGQCVVANAPELTKCDDGDPCTKRSFCVAGYCDTFTSDVVSCDDGDPCTDDVCTEAGSCEHAASADPGCGLDPCGDGVCDAGEEASCPQDCPTGGGGGGGGVLGCGDGVCDQATFESVWCPQDCSAGGGGGGAAGCGDGVCDQA